jgi:hypothetical protein
MAKAPFAPFAIAAELFRQGENPQDPQQNPVFIMPGNKASHAFFPLEKLTNQPGNITISLKSTHNITEQAKVEI